jgi:hypothetical protein
MINFRNDGWRTAVIDHAINPVRKIKGIVFTDTEQFAGSVFNANNDFAARHVGKGDGRPGQTFTAGQGFLKFKGLAFYFANYVADIRHLCLRY